MNSRLRYHGAIHIGIAQNVQPVACVSDSVLRIREQAVTAFP
jgi:hypothetical protein